MELNPKQLTAVLHALRLNIKHLEAIENDVTADEDDKIDAKNERGYLRGLAGAIELEIRKELGLKPSDPL